MTFHYILQVICFQLMFLLVFDGFLRRETFFRANRLYLLITPLLSLALPTIKFDVFRQTIPEQLAIELPAVLVGEMSSAEAAAAGSYSVFTLLWVLGMLVSFVLLLLKVFRFATLVNGSTMRTIHGTRIRVLEGSNTAFTFLNTVYLGSNLTERQKEQILAHERIHVRQWHSVDLVVFELLKVLFWFNPLIYIYQTRLSVLHEFIADRAVVRNSSRHGYYEQLLAQTFQTDNFPFINTFFKHSLIKKRIIMLKRSNSKRIAGLRYLLIIPALGLMLAYTSCAQESEDVTIGSSDTNEFTQADDSEIMANIAALKQSIAAKGEMTDEERKALKSLYAASSDKGENEMFFGSEKENPSIPFSTIQKVPVYPGCEGLDNSAAQKCFTTKVAEFVVQNFNSKGMSQAGIKGKQRISVVFTISDKGIVENVKAKAQHSELIDEAIRVVEDLPRMTPGEHEGKKVNVAFALPIIFEW